jgi:hypothetical protein
LSVIGCRLLENPSTSNYQPSTLSKDGLNNILTGIEPGEILVLEF